MLNLARMKGLTLTELMVSLVISSFIVLAAGTFYVTTHRASLDQLSKADQVTQFFRAEKAVVGAIRRAGYKSSLSTVLEHLSGTEGSVGQDLLPAIAAPGDGSCVITTHASPTEVYQQQAFKLLDNGEIGVNIGLDLSCSDETWSSITDANKLEFHVLSVVLVEESKFNADTAANNADPSLDCTTENRGQNCLIRQLWRVTLCASADPAIAINSGLCDETTPFYSDTLVTPRNPILIARYNDSDDGKVTICHNGNTLSISQAGWDNGHSNHPNDSLGAC